MSCPDCEGVGGHDCAAYGRMAELTTAYGYMPQVLQDGAWTDLLNKCVSRRSTAHVVTTAVCGAQTRVVRRTVTDRVVKS